MLTDEKLFVLYSLKDLHVYRARLIIITDNIYELLYKGLTNLVRPESFLPKSSPTSFKA